MSIGNYEKCVGCTYYYGEIDQCMFGEEDVPDNFPKKCETEPKSNNSSK